MRASRIELGSVAAALPWTEQDRGQTTEEDPDMARTLRLLATALAVASMPIGWSVTGVAAAQSACADLGGTAGGDHVCHVTSAGSNYTIAFDFPDDYPDQQPVADYLNKERAGFVQFAQLPASQRYGHPYAMLARGSTYRSAISGTQTLLLRMGQDADPHPLGWFKAFNYNLNTHAPVTLDTLFKPGTDPLAVLNQTLVSRYGQPVHGALTADDYKNFAITDDAVIFYFDQGQILGHERGEFEMSVPRSELAPVLAV
jgi:hypothetical protein